MQRTVAKGIFMVEEQNCAKCVTCALPFWVTVPSQRLVLPSTSLRITINTKWAPSTQPCHNQPSSLPPDFPTFRWHLEPSELEYYLSWGIPVVVTDVHIQGTYEPAYFHERFGSKPMVLQHCETGQKKHSTVEKFFGTSGEPESQDGIWKLKVCHCHCFSNIQPAHGYDRTGPLKKTFTMNFPRFLTLSWILFPART
jgi:hypothetical protein